MKISNFFFLLLALPCLVSGQNIVQLVIRTATDVEGSGCDCAVGVSITNGDLVSCDIPGLESSADDFEPGVTLGYEVCQIKDDIFYNDALVAFLKDSQLGACLGFPLPDKAVQLTVINNDSDSWMPDYIRIILDDQTWIECPNEEGLVADNSFIELNCYS